MARIADEANLKLGGMNVYALIDSERIEQLGLPSSASIVPLKRGLNFPMLTKLLGRGSEGQRARTYRNGQQIEFGVLLDPNNVFPRVYPDIATPLRLANDRRNKIPASHPYDKKTGLPTKYLRRSERDNLTAALTGAYQHVMNLLDPYI
jgi:hypothetical protein